jgi:K+-sensing histidine kinase KdpD
MAGWETSEFLDTRRVLDEIIERARSDHRLVDDMLLLTAIETSELLGQHSEILLEQMILECLSPLQASAHARGIAWELSPTSRVTVRCDAYAVVRALQAILQSALDRARLDSVIRVGLRNDAHFALLTISFQSNHGGASDNADMRLAVARSVVDAHGGTLSTHVQDGGMIRISMLLPTGRTT